MMTKRELLEYVDNRVRNCLYLLEKMPEDKWHWQPAEHMMSLGELANHVATMLDIESGMFSGGLNKQSYDKRLGELRKSDKSALLALARECHARAMKFYAGMSEEDFETETFVTPAGTTMSYKGGVLAELEHFAHHRSQLYTYLQLLNVKIDPCDMWA
jgi:uncharacterized damage-inducible protein DinB